MGSGMFLLAAMVFNKPGSSVVRATCTEHNVILKWSKDTYLATFVMQAILLG